MARCLLILAQNAAERKVNQQPTSSSKILKGAPLNKTLLTFAIVTLSIFVAGSAFAQATATQTVTLAVNAVYRISTSGNPGPLTITDGTPGSDNLTPVTDNSTTYSMTQNFGNTVKITAGLTTALGAGYTLRINLASSRGTSAGDVNISNGTPLNVVTAINRGADLASPITYTFSALASAGVLTSTTNTVTLTLTN